MFLIFGALIIYHTFEYPGSLKFVVMIFVIYLQFYDISL